MDPSPLDPDHHPPTLVYLGFSFGFHHDYVDGSMQGITRQRISLDHLGTGQGDETLVISARVYQGDETSVISARSPSSWHRCIKGPMDRHPTLLSCA